MHRSELLLKRVVKWHRRCWLKISRVATDISHIVATLAHARVVPSSTFHQVRVRQSTTSTDSLVLNKQKNFELATELFYQQSTKLTGLKVNIWQRRWTGSAVVYCDSVYRDESEGDLYGWRWMCVLAAEQAYFMSSASGVPNRSVTRSSYVIKEEN